MCWSEIMLLRGQRRRKQKLFSCTHLECALLLTPKQVWSSSMTPLRYERNASCFCWFCAWSRQEGWTSKFCSHVAKATVETCSYVCWFCRRWTQWGSAARWTLRGQGSSIWQWAIFTAQSSRPCQWSPPSIVILTHTPTLKQSLNFYLNRKALCFLDRTDLVATNLWLQLKKQTSVWHVPCSSAGHQWHHT